MKKLILLIGVMVLASLQGVTFAMPVYITNSPSNTDKYYLYITVDNPYACITSTSGGTCSINIPQTLITPSQKVQLTPASEGNSTFTVEITDSRNIMIARGTIELAPNGEVLFTSISCQENIACVAGKTTIAMDILRDSP